MPTLKTSLLALLAATSTFALPAPQATTSTTSAVPTHVEFACGCWNQCTLQQLADPTVTGCDSSCDPRLTCDTLSVMELAFSDSTAITATPATPTDNVKRAIASEGRPPRHNLFMPNGQVGDKAKRHLPGGTGPTFPDPYPPDDVTRAKRDPVLEELAECVCVRDPCPCDIGGGLTEPFKDKRSTNLKKRGGSAGAACDLGPKGEIKSCTVSVGWQW